MSTLLHQLEFKDFCGVTRLLGQLLLFREILRLGRHIIMLTLVSLSKLYIWCSYEILFYILAVKYDVSWLIGELIIRYVDTPSLARTQILSGFTRLD